MQDIYSRLISAAHSGAFGKNGSPEPSLANLNAGNYKKGRLLLHGLPIAIETPQGHRRTGKSNGEPWSVICQAHYGYLVGTKASDGDAIDVYVGPVPESQSVFVVNQNSATGAFDEVKVLLGFLDEESARTAYMNSYERDWKGLGSMVGASIDQFKWWIKFGDTTQPFTQRALPYDGNQEMNQTVWDSAANPVGLALADVIYGLRKDDSDGLLLDAVSAADILEDSDGELVLDALVVEYAKVERKAAQLLKVMEAASGEVKPVASQVTPPFKQKGTTNVVILFELSDGQTVSIFMHNPDSTPNKILPADELVSWKWLLNKKDITVVVAPEKGQDLNAREVARRIMKLAEKNSARFAQANQGRADRMAAIEQLKGDVSGKEATLQALDEQFRELSDKVEVKRNAPAPAALQTNDQPEPPEAGEGDVPDPAAVAVAQTNDQPEPAVPEPLDVAALAARLEDIGSYTTVQREAEAMDQETRNALGAHYGYEGVPAAFVIANLVQAAVSNRILTEKGYAAISDNDEALEANQDQLDHFFGERLIEVRNALRELGWEGAKWKPLTKNGHALEQHLKQIGGGKNIVGMHFTLSGVPGFFMSDTLAHSPAELAAKINMGISAAESAAQPASEPEADDSGDLKPEGRENVVKTAKGTKVATGFKVVEASRLIVSHDKDGNPNPDYPHELQPRDRARATSQAWVQKTARNLDPDSLGRTQRADSGAPIVGPDGVVESGNGRTMAIKEAYRLKEADEYRAWLIEEAGYFGLDAAKISRMKAPVLVRVRTSDVDRAAFAVEANQDDKLAMTATEKARSDAKRLTDAVIAKMAADGDLLAAGNRDFIAAFLQSLGDAEAAQYLTTGGQPTAGLVARLQAAIFAKAYNDDRLLELTADSAKPEIASIISALNIAAPDFIRAQAADKASTEDAASKLADSVELSLNQQAVDAIIGATGVLKRAKDSGLGLDEFLRQGDMFGDIDPAVAAMAIFISKNNRSAKRMGVAFKAMAEFVQGEIEKRQTGSLFGDAEETGFADIVAAANRKLDQEYGEGAFSIGTDDMFTAPAAPTEPAEAPQAAPQAIPEEDTSVTEAKSYLQEVIAGNVDYMDPELVNRLEAINDAHADNAEVMALFNDAANAYSDHMVSAMRQAIA